MPKAASFCGRCGERQAQLQTAEAGACPACSSDGHEVQMQQWSLLPNEIRPQGFPLCGCPRCGGAWVETETLSVMLDSIARSETVLAVKRRAMPRGMLHAKVRYRRCVQCHQAMHRRNFGRISGVIVDECRLHGTFFDAGELEDVVEFVRSGGLKLAERQRVREDAATPLKAANSWGGGYEQESGGSGIVRWAWNLLERALER